MGLVEPINSRITDPRYFLNTPQQGKAGTSPAVSSEADPLLLPGLCSRKARCLQPGSDWLSLLAPIAVAILEKVGRPNLKLQLVSLH